MLLRRGLLVLVLIVILLLAACSTSNTSTSTSAVSSPATISQPPPQVTTQAATTTQPSTTAPQYGGALRIINAPNSGPFGDPANVTMLHPYSYPANFALLFLDIETRPPPRLATS
jgi:hypothetical protein